MFTVKHISLIGEESLSLVATTRYTPRGLGDDPRDPNVCSKDAPATLWVRDTANGPEYPMTGGTIFVMNDKGKTVARYDLGASPVPHLGTIEEPKTWRDETATPCDPAFAQPMTISVAKASRA